MRSDLSYVEQLVATPGMDYRHWSLGRPFTVTEQAELAVREKIQLDRGPALALAAGYGNYGGYFSDPRRARLPTADKPRRRRAAAITTRFRSLPGCGSSS